MPASMASALPIDCDRSARPLALASKRLERKPKGSQPLTEIIVQITGDTPSLFFLCHHEAAQQPDSARLGLGSVGDLGGQQGVGFCELPGAFFDSAREGVARAPDVFVSDDRDRRFVGKTCEPHALRVGAARDERGLDVPAVYHRRASPIGCRIRIRAVPPAAASASGSRIAGLPGEEHRHMQALGLSARIPEHTLRAGAPGRDDPARVQRHERVFREAVDRGAQNLVARGERSDVRPLVTHGAAPGEAGVRCLRPLRW